MDWLFRRRLECMINIHEGVSFMGSFDVRFGICFGAEWLWLGGKEK